MSRWPENGNDMGYRSRMVLETKNIGYKSQDLKWRNFIEIPRWDILNVLRPVQKITGSVRAERSMVYFNQGNDSQLHDCLLIGTLNISTDDDLTLPVIDWHRLTKRLNHKSYLRQMTKNGPNSTGPPNCFDILEQLESHFPNSTFSDTTPGAQVRTFRNANGLEKHHQIHLE
ncbi:hypothetical protein EYC84_003264 [Monilinia fructicola]|uniref:Uncharacterized protein n=1 Tax=Monilinia fructicola TaxID=38448 RepID=A0A5M9JVL7_MONFR|nr:hypothetical protein EYC84_003264 [Monilinia fructicola]